MKILSKRKLPLIETGNEQGRHRLVSVLYALFMMSLMAIYLTLMYLSNEYFVPESSIIAAFGIMSIITYLLAIFVRPEYAQLPENKSDQ